MNKSRVQRTQMDPNIKIGPGPESFICEDSEGIWYPGAVGSLMYVMLGKCVDMAFAMSVLIHYPFNPTAHHITAVERVSRYLRGTVALDLVFSREIGPLTGYTDADWGGDLATRRSTASYIFNIGSGAIGWPSKH
jgi:hypothetical protein